MKNKRCLGFLFITLTLMVSMFSNVFASSKGYWTCVGESGTHLSVGNTVNYASNISFWNCYPMGASVRYASSFSVEPGDSIELGLGADLVGNETDIDGAASVCVAELIAENGAVIASVTLDLSGSNYTDYRTSSAHITNATAGKLKLYIFAEGTGVSGVETRITDVYVEVDGYEV